uniref:XPG-I domain-containing protein n=1 Tax=Timema monikensis TaxID=170555 RepID=A0A7R9EJZ0_9NEOP|nr:unnamed protein product [Timema monikensis]
MEDCVIYGFLPLFILFGLPPLPMWSLRSVFQLGRDQLVLLALLVGSDYTVGLRGVGPVTALEILAAFPPADSEDILAGLQMFRDWLKGGKMIATQATQLRHKLRNVILNDDDPIWYMNPGTLGSSGSPSLQVLIIRRPSPYSPKTGRVTPLDLILISQPC